MVANFLSSLGGIGNFLGNIDYNKLGLGAQLMGAGQGGQYGSPPPNQWGQAGQALAQFAYAQRQAQMDELKKKELENRLRVAQEAKAKEARAEAAWQQLKQPGLDFQPRQDGGAVKFGQTREQAVANPQAMDPRTVDARLAAAAGKPPWAGMDPMRQRAIEIAGEFGGPAAGAGMFGELATAGGGKPLVTKPGDVIRNPANPAEILAQNDPASQTEVFNVRQGSDVVSYRGDQSKPKESWVEVGRAPWRPASQVNIDMGAKTSEALLAIDSDYIKEMQTNVAASRGLTPRLESIAGILESGNVDTGRFKSAALPVRQWAEDLGFTSDPTLPQAEQVKAAMAFMAPRMRVEGSGSTSDNEMRAFRDAAPQYANTSQGNIILARSMMQVQKRNEKALDLSRRYLRENKSLAGFEEHADKTLGPVFPAPKTQGEYDKIPSGTVFMDTDGQFTVKK